MEGLHQHWGVGNGTYVVVTLQGTIKGETNNWDHLVPCVPTTSLGVAVKSSLERLLALTATKGFMDGSVILDLAGWAYSTKGMSDSLLEMLEDLSEMDRGLFPADIVSKEFLRDLYQAFHSFCRPLDTWVAEMNIGPTDTYIVNQRQCVEGAQGQ